MPVLRRQIFKEIRGFWLEKSSSKQKLQMEIWSNDSGIGLNWKMLYFQKKSVTFQNFTMDKDSTKMEPNGCITGYLTGKEHFGLYE